MNPFRQLLRAAGSKPPIGTWISSASPIVAEAIGHAGFDWGVVDMEHAPLDMMSLVHLLQALAGTKTTPIVRVPWNDAVMVKRVLDAGATTVLFPFVQSVEDARRAVASTRYPPRGVRGVGSSFARSSRWGRVEGYAQAADAQMCVLVQVETVAGLGQLAAIADVEGVDGVFFGPADLAASMGLLGQSTHADVKRAIEGGIATVRAAGKAAGVLAVDVALARRYLDQGAQFVAVGADVSLMVRACRELAGAFGRAVP